MGEPKNKPWIIGLITTLTIVALVLFYNFLKGSDLFDKNHYFYVYFPEVDGLYESNKVLINGMRVGKVSAIHFASDGSGRLIVELQILPEHKLQTSTTASIINTGLIGGRMIRLNDAYGPGPYLQDGDTIEGQIEPSYTEAFNLDFESLLLRADTLLQNLNRLSSSANEILDKPTKEKISDAISHLHSSSAQLDIAMRKAPSLVGRADSAAGALQQAGVEIKALSSSAKGVVDSIDAQKLASLIAEGEATMLSMRTVVERLEAGQGSLGKLSKEDSLYLQLQRTVVQMDSLISNVKRNPKKYLKISVF